MQGKQLQGLELTASGLIAEPDAVADPELDLRALPQARHRRH